MKFQKLLWIETTKNDIRSEAQGWSIESGKCARDALDCYGFGFTRQGALPVGLIPSPKESHCFPTVLHAMGNGWRVMAPPEKIQTSYTDKFGHCCFDYHYTWMLEKTEE